MEDNKEVQAEIETREIDFNTVFNFALAQRYKNVIKILQGFPSYAGILGEKDFCKDNLFKWLAQPRLFEKQLREMSRRLFRCNGQYYRLCNYQPNMVKFAYVVCPVSTPSDYSVDDYMDSYEKAAQFVDNMNLRTEFTKILATATRDGVAYGYAKRNKDAFCILIFDPDYCKMTSIDGTGCIRFAFNYSFFGMLDNETRNEILESFGSEFKDGWARYNSDMAKYMWQEIGENGICVKYQEDILEYSIPPYIAVIDPLFEIEDYRKLTKAREEAGNYNLLNFRIPTTPDGKILMDSKIVTKFIEQVSSEVPSSIGIMYSPMDTEKFNFSKESTVSDRSAITDAEEQFWASSGVSELLFGSGKSSSNALTKSIIADEINIYPLVRQIERWVNRMLKLSRGKYKFKIKILDVTSFNENEQFETYKKAGDAGLPVKNAIAATLGMTPFEVLQMSRLENDILDMRNKVYNQPLMSANTMASEVDNEGGRPEMQEDELSDEGETTRINERNIRE